MPAPPRIPSTPATRRVFAHLLAADLACPNCGIVHPAPPGRRRILRKRHRQSTGYDELTGIFRCRVCKHGYLLGVLYWPLTGVRRHVRASDTVPLPEEAIALRQDASRVVLGSHVEARGHANRISESSDPTDPTDDPTDDAGE